MLTMDDVVREGHKSLRTVADKIELPLSDEDRKTLFSMFEYIVNSQNDELVNQYNLRPSVGIAAPQINVSKRMLAVHTLDEKGEKVHSYMLINPQIVSHSEELTYLPTGEGCLSVDRPVEGFVPRYKRITVQAHLLKQDGTVDHVKIRLKNYVAVVVQHEIDHLDGILFVDKIDKENPLKPIPKANPIEF